MEIFLQRRHAFMVEYGTVSYIIDYFTISLKIINLKGHLNNVSGLRVTEILLNVMILPIGGASAVKGLLSTGPTPSIFNRHSVAGTVLQIHS